jgi:glycosyltransferase involved in cell wall biosynthesis
MALDIEFVIIALNEEVLLARCIKSVRSEAPGSQIIVVDNGSTDRTVEVALSFPGVTVVHEKHKVISHARQAGLLAASSEWVAFLDADNELPDMWLLEATRVLWYAKREGVVALSGPIMYHELFVLTKLFIYMFYCIGRILHIFAPMLQGGNSVLNREAILAVGGFDTAIEFYGEDTIVAQRLSHVGKIKFDLAFYIYGSARRFAAEGLWRVGARYALNYFWIWIVGRPLSKTHHDHRAPVL